MRASSWLLAGCLVASGCKKPAPTPESPVAEGPLLNLPAPPYSYSETAFPASWLDDPAMNLFAVSATSNPVTDAGATLGRVLFYDRSLSDDGLISCASCHQPQHGFADDTPFSEGVGGGQTHRNTMALINLAYQPRLFWDGREDLLEDQVLQPIQHPDEMGMDLDELTDLLATFPHYPQLFSAAFGDPEITSERIARGLAQFLRSLQATGSRHDAGLANGFADFSQQELAGKSVFFSQTTRCAQCHGTRNFYTPSELMVNGLSTDYGSDGDSGLGAITNNPQQDGLFRVVSLRNIGLTAPYMHDGRFASLREVVDFYADGIQPHPQLNHRLSLSGIGENGQPPLTMDLSDADREALVAFLHTLSDTTDFSRSPWGSPF